MVLEPPRWPNKAGRTPIVCGHRGVPVAEPENTIASFREAAARGATWIEFDVRPIADGTLIVHHDPVTSAGLHLASAKYEDLEPSIPRFGDVVAAVPQLGLDIEMKTDQIDMSSQDYARVVNEQIDIHCRGRSDIIVTSFSATALREVRAQRPERPTGFLFHDISFEAALAIAQEDGHVALAPWIDLVTPDMVAMTQRVGLGVLTWTVNEPSQIELAVTTGVDMIIGDDPATIIAEV